MNPLFSIIRDNIPQWERALSLFERATGLTTSLYYADGKRALGPFVSTPLGETLLNSGAFAEGMVAHRAEIEEMIPVVALGEIRHKKFADSLAVIFIPIMVNDSLIGAVATGWVFDHFADPLECDRLAKIFGLQNLDFWVMARTQSPVSPEKLHIYQDMLGLIVSTLTDQMIALRELTHSMKIKDDILLLVSHELKTPMTSLMLRLQMLKGHKVPEWKFDSFMEKLEVSAKVQTRLIEDLVDAAEISSGHFHLRKGPLDLSSILQETVKLVSGIAEEKSVLINFSHLGGDYRSVGDGARLKQVFMELLLNAVKASPKKSGVDVRLDRNISTFVISIRDRGKGITEDVLPRIFQVFSHGIDKDLSDRGLGLGLYIAKNIIQKHGGTIDVESKGVGSGATFVVRIPI